MAETLTALQSVAAVVGRTAAVYFFLLVGLRLTGKREVGQLTLFDLVVLLLVANSVQNAMVGPDNTLVGGLVSAGTLLVANYAVARTLERWPRLRKTVEGTPTVLIYHGEVVAANLRHEGIDDGILQAALREHGVADVKDVDVAVLEVDGSISVVTTSVGTKRIRRPLKFLTHR